MILIQFMAPKKDSICFRLCWVLVIALSAKDDSYLVITGDLADTDHEKNYMFIKDAVEAKFGQRYAVLPGNHDDVAILRNVFAGHTESFYHEGVPVSLIPTIWDPSAGKDVGIGQFDRQCKDKMMLGQSLVFTHYPVFDTMHIGICQARVLEWVAIADPTKTANLMGYSVNC